MTLLAGIEGGGTKFVAMIGNDQGDVLHRERFPTTTPDETMPLVLDYFMRQQAEYPFAAIGIGSFGPVDPDPKSLTYGHITTTPKAGWMNYDLVGDVAQAFDVPIGFNTDVNAAALGEYYWGAAQGLTDFLYVTIGTGIGGGAMVGGRLLHGAMHPEMGHMHVPQDHERDPFEGICPYHKNCLEGLASGPALKARWQVESAMDLLPAHVAWELEAEYLGSAVSNWILTFSPQKIILGGGVMKQKQLLSMIHKKVLEYLAGYVENDTIKCIQETVVLPGLGDNAGGCGALALAKQALHAQEDLTV